MRSKLILSVCLIAITVPACATTPPPSVFIDANHAVAIAKQICRGKADPSVRWGVTENTGFWTTDQLVGETIWGVVVPMEGPSRSQCAPRSGSMVDCRCLRQPRSGVPPQP